MWPLLLENHRVSERGIWGIASSPAMAMLLLLLHMMNVRHCHASRFFPKIDASFKGKRIFQMQESAALFLLAQEDGSPYEFVGAILFLNELHQVFFATTIHSAVPFLVRKQDYFDAAP
ncbi:MAG: hypothetical protein LBB76_08870 [Azoarcus sp.]|jgi:hypothetical protein|nr:hypothetical protein [Azoarcus sp.]